MSVVNALHNVLAGAGLHANLGLPQIAVVGSQSVGKTSVLQSLVGRDFLPRGTGIVTRRPLVLQLRMTQRDHAQGSDLDAVGHSSGVEPNEWAEFDHKLGERFTDFSQVCKEIEAETARVCDETGISEEPILLRIFSPDVMDLTLVDLPGLTRVPTKDQPADIASTIRGLVLQYVQHKSCLILAVSAANVDLATSDALALAREVDPLGERTLGVLTKLDLADESGAAIRALQGRVYPLKLGYIGVVCRSEAQLKAGIPFEEAQKAEEEILARNGQLRQVAGQCGINNLARRLHELLLQHIRATLPELRERVQHVAEDCRQELASFGDLSRASRMGRGAFFLHLISGYARNYADALEGRLAYSQQEAPPDKLVGGARLHYIFHRVFAQAVLDFDAFSGLSDMEVRVAMRNAAGPKPQLFVPEVAFETLVKRQIHKLEEPCLQCVHLVHEELKHLASQSEVPEMQSYPGLRERVLEVAQTLIRRCLQPTSQTVSNLIKIELAHINVDHPDFIGGVTAMSRVHQACASDGQGHLTRLGSTQSLVYEEDTALRDVSPWMPDRRGNNVAVFPERSASAGHVEQRRSRWGDPLRGPIPEDTVRLPNVPLVVKPAEEPTEKERMDIELLKSLVSSYYAIVQRKIIDVVPKSIMHFMVNAVRDALHHECITELYNDNLVETLLEEADETRRRRLNCQRKLDELRQAQDILAQIRDAH